MATTPSSAGPPKRRPRRAAKKSTTVVVASTPEEEVVMRTGDSAPVPGSFLGGTGSVRHSEITTFLRQLIMLLEAGTPLLRSLRTMSERGRSASARALIADITAYVEAGNPLWQAFDRHTRYFDSVFVNLIKASEASGTLVPVLRRMVEYREARQIMRKRVKGAMVYPVILVAACLAILLFITKFVVPAFEETFKTQDLDLPPLTQNFIKWSYFVGDWWWVPVVALVLLILIYRYWFVRGPNRRLFADYWKLKIPIMGPILQKNAIVEMSRTMGLLLRSGLSMMATLDLTRAAIHNKRVAQTLQGVRDSVEAGGGFEEPLRREESVIPAVVTDMFVTGEEAGRVDQIAEQISEVYEEEVKIAVTTLGETLQPVFTIFVGIVVIVLFVALFFPLVSMIDQIASAGV